MAEPLRIPTQQEMSFAEAQRRRAQRDAECVRSSAVEAEVKRVVDHFGSKEFADRLGLEDDTLVYHWLSHRGGRRTPWELVDVALDLDDTGRLIAAICRDRFEVPKRVSRLTPDEEIAALRRALQEFGTAGEQKLRTIATARPEDLEQPPREARRG